MINKNSYLTVKYFIQILYLMIITLKGTIFQISKLYRPEISVDRASAFGAGGRGFKSRPQHTKGVKNGTSSSLADARIRKIK